VEATHNFIVNCLQNCRVTCLSPR